MALKRNPRWIALLAALVASSVLASPPSPSAKAPGLCQPRELYQVPSPFGKQSRVSTSPARPLHEQTLRDSVNG